MKKSQLRKLIREEIQLLKESDSKGINKLIKLLVKRGNNKKEATRLVKKRYDYIKRVYPNASLSKQAEIIKTLGEEISTTNGEEYNIPKAFKKKKKKIVKEEITSKDWKKLKKIIRMEISSLWFDLYKKRNVFIK